VPPPAAATSSIAFWMAALVAPAYAPSPTVMVLAMGFAPGPADAVAPRAGPPRPIIPAAHASSPTTAVARHAFFFIAVLLNTKRRPPTLDARPDQVQRNRPDQAQTNPDRCRCEGTLSISHSNSRDTLQISIDVKGFVWPPPPRRPSAAPAKVSTPLEIHFAQLARGALPARLDSDKDGLLDEWEMHCIGDLSQGGGVGGRRGHERGYAPMGATWITV